MPVVAKSSFKYLIFFIPTKRLILKLGKSLLLSCGRSLSSIFSLINVCESCAIGKSLLLSCRRSLSSILSLINVCESCAKRFDSNQAKQLQKKLLLSSTLFL